MALNIQDLANIRPALLIAIETHGTMIQDKKIWIDILEKIEQVISEHTANNTPSN